MAFFGSIGFVMLSGGVAVLTTSREDAFILASSTEGLVVTFSTSAEVLVKSFIMSVFAMLLDSMVTEVLVLLMLSPSN